MQLDQIFSGAFEWLSGPLGTGLAIFMLIFGGLAFWAFSNVAIWDDAEDNIGNEAFWVTMVVFVPFVGIPLYALVRLLLVLHTLVTDLCDQGYRRFIGGNKLIQYSPVGTPMKQQLRYTIYRQAGGGVNTEIRPDLMKGPRTIGSRRPDPEYKPFTATIAGEKGALLRETRARASRGEPIEIAVINSNFMPRDAAATRKRSSEPMSPFEISRKEHQKMSWRARMRELRNERLGQGSRPSA